MTKRTDDELALAPRLRRVPLRRLVVLAAFEVACSSDATGPRAVASVHVTPLNAQTEIGSTVHLLAMPRDASGGDLPGRTVTWSSGNTAVATVNDGGVVTGASLGTVQITATSEGMSGQATVAVVPGSATELLFTTPPASVTAGTPFTPAVQVTARDAFGNTATGFAGPVTLAIAANPGSAALSGTTTVAAVSGVATFPGVSLDKSGVGYTLQASAGGLPTVTSASFAVTPAAATHLVFSVQPGTTAAGATMAPALQVTARDAFGNTATGFTGAVTIAIGTNPAGGTLSGTTTVNAVSGVAIFGSLAIDRSGSGYTLGAAAAGLSSAISTSFSITTASISASLSTVAAAPATITASSGGSTSTVTVTARDALGNPVSGVPVVLGASGGGNTVTQPGFTNATGVATGTVSSTAVGVKVISATVGGVAITQTATVTVDPGVATQLAFTVQPSTTPAGYPITPTVQVAALDAFGNATPGFAGTVTAAIGSNPTGAALSGTTAVAAVAGVATFSNLSINRVGTGYSLTASATGLAGAASSAFTIITGEPGPLVFTVQPSTTAAGAAITPAVQVTASDLFGNTNTGFTGTLCVAIGTNPSGTGVLSGTACRNAVAGIATFDSLSIDRAGAGYTLIASATALPGATSTPFTITAGAAAVITLVSGDAQTDTIGAPLGTPYVVRVSDAQGNGVSGVTVTWVVTGGGGSIAPTSQTDAIGQAQATRVLGNTLGAQTTTASVTGLAGSPVSFTATAGPGNPSQLAFTVQPSTTSAGVPIAPAVEVTARDRIGTPTTDFTGNVTVAIGTNPPGTGVLDGATSVAAVLGVAAFPGLNIDEPGAGYTLTASAPGVSGVTSSAFDVTVGPAATIALVSGDAQTDTVGATLALPYAVRVTDALGNGVSGVTVTWAVTGGGGSITPTSQTNATGQAQATRVLGNALGAQTATASVTGLAGSPVPFAATAGPGNPSQLAFTVQPVTTLAGAPFAPAVRVAARDRLGNATPGFTGSVTVAIGTNPSGGSVSGAAVMAAVAGVATFSSLSIDKAATGYTLTATATGLTGSTSSAFTITPGPATQLVFTVQPTSTGAGTTITPAVRVTAHDAFGNTATGFTNTVTVAIATNPAGGTLSGTTTIAAAAGVATFSNLSIDHVGTGYTLTASATGLAGATSGAFDVATVISPTQSTLTSATDTIGQCLTSCALGLDASRITVTVRDASGNPLAGVPVTLSASPADSVVFANPGASGATNGSGVFAADFRSVRAVSRTISAVAGGVTLSQTATVRVMPVLVGAGDIATCTVLSDDAVAALLDSIPGTVFTLGDNAYEHGTATEFATCYDPTWGRHKARTRAVVGNRDYDTPEATGHYGYFGAAANPSGGTGNEAGYYSFDVGAWHVVALNTEVATASNSAQLAWLLQDLNGRSNQCVVAMWHKPMWGSSSAASGSAVPLWQVAADSGVELVLNGHAHIYERLTPMDAAGNPSATGARQITVGTGGVNLGGFSSDPPTSVVRDRNTHGVLRIVLYPGSYRWEFIPAPGFGSFTDSGSASCH